MGKRRNTAIINDCANNNITNLSHGIAANVDGARLAIIIFEMPKIGVGGAWLNQLIPCQFIRIFRHAFFGKRFWGSDMTAVVGVISV